MQTHPSNTNKLEPLAIIGIGCRFPGNVHSLEDLWKLLISKTDAISDYPSSRNSNADTYVDSNREKNKIITKRGGFIDNVEYFDADFFNISPLEAEKIDPAQRILLEVTQEAIENAGLTEKMLQDSETGVFVGNWTSDYEHRLQRANQDIDVYATTGSGRYALSGRVSYFYNLQGPSLTVDTACSSSIVALNIASQSLRSGECNMAFVGASNTITDFFVSIGYSRSGLLSEYGECRFGDQKSTGYVRSEGAAMIIIKRLSDAVRDGDRIHALVLSTACNSDGQSHKNLFAPSATTQEIMIRKAIRNSGVHPNDIIYVEAHGTGTKAGDPTEIKSIWNALSDNRTKEDKIYAGSVKTNFGHTEAAAGLAGMLKVITSIQHKTILPSLHFDQPNPKVAWDEIGLTIPKEPIPWVQDKPLIAGVNTFGITGTNAHAILSEAPAAASKDTELRNDIYVLPLTAKDEQALLQLAKKYAAFIAASDNAPEDICAMAALRRTHYPIREVFVAESKEMLLEKIQDFVDNNAYESKKVFDQEDAVQTVFVFPGQGAQWIQMGKTLYDNELVYRTALDEINLVYKNYVSWDLLEELNKNEQESRLHEIDIVQPVLVAVEIALANLWMSKGIFPDVVVGHSMGEVAAAYVAGNITLHEAAQIIIIRSRLMKQVSGHGEMGATDLTVEEANELLKGYEDKLAIAVMNSRNSTVLSGDPEALNAVFSVLEQQGRFNRKVKVDVASHSPQMDGIKEELQKNLQHLQPKDATIQFFSTVYNELKSGNELDAAYWANNLRQPVQFGNVIRQLSEKHHVVYVEMSPHPTLLHAINENTASTGQKAKAVGSFVRDRNEQIAFYENFTEIFNANIPFDWTSLYPEIRTFIELPTYAWQKERYWIDAAPVLVPQPADAPENNIDKNLYELQWDEVALHPEFAPGQILILKDTYGYYQYIENVLKDKGCNVQVLDAQDGLSGVEAAVVLHMSSVHKDSLYSYYYDGGVDALQRIVRHFSEKKQTKICVLTNGAQVLEEDHQVNLNAALLTGLLRSVQNEYSHISFVQLDISSYIHEAEIHQIPALLFADKSYTELAIRADKIYTPSIVKQTALSLTKMIQPDATYLVTGGNSGLGLETVKWLSGKGAKDIAIVSRSGLSATALAEIHQLEKNGVRVISYLADVANERELSHVVEQIKLKQSPVKGLFHAAGLLDDALFENLTREKFEHTLQAKANGAWSLHNLFAENSLDIFVVYSSVIGILGAAGQSNYAAANTLLDALIHYRKKHHLAGLSVNFGTIADIGLAARQENRGDRLKDFGLLPLPQKELFHYFDRLFLSADGQLMAMDIDFEKWIDNNPKAASNHLYDRVRAKVAAAKEEETVAFSSFSEAVKYAKQQIKQAIASVTKMNAQKIKEDDTFKSYGVDSLLALQIKNKLQKDLAIALNVSVIWSHPTVNKLADYIAKQLKQEETKQEEPIQQTQEMDAKETGQPSLTIEQTVESLSLEELLKQLNDKVN
ncbi:MAG: type I polyketide synthase [Chitinophagales bacterium]